MDFMLGCDAEGNIGKEVNAMKHSLENLRDIVEIMLTGQCIDRDSVRTLEPLARKLKHLTNVQRTIVRVAIVFIPCRYARGTR